MTDLFGQESPSKARNSGLFDDDRPTAGKTGNSLFSDDLGGSQESPWALPTPKKAARSQLIRNLLSAATVPDEYIDAYDNLLASGRTAKGEVTVERIKKLLADSGVSSDVQQRILGIIVPAGNDVQGLGRGEFNVLFALIGLAQEGDEVTLDGVDERRKNLPVPNLPSLKPASAVPSTPQHREQEPRSTYATPSAQAADTSSPTKKQSVQRKQSFGLDADPWASPELHRGHSHASNNNTSTPKVNGGAAANPGLPQRTTSSFTTSSAPPPADADAPIQSGQQSTSGYSAGWGDFNAPPAAPFQDSGLGGGFGGNLADSGDSNRDPTGLEAVFNAARAANSGNEETITVTTIPEMEGTMFFQHRNYHVTSARRNTKVIRRYSDFVWLLDCLYKRYPFRQLPLLPPKRVAINGNHLATDTTFVERRRRGLSRFANALVRHPVLSQEQLVVMFLTVPTELSVWRKQATISVQDEFQGKALPPNLEDSLSPTLQELFDRVRSGVKRSAEIYINLANQVERIAKRKEGLAVEYQRCSTALSHLTEVTADTYAADVSDLPPLNAGLGGAAKHLNNAHGLLIDEARAWDEGVLEDLKTQRDSLVSIRDMFDRRDRLDKDEIPKLEKRIKSNEDRLRNMRGRPEGVGKPGDIEKVEEAIFKDKEAIVAAHARHVFIKECIRDEIVFFQQTQYGVSRLHQDWAGERVKYAELLAENWRAAGEEVEVMPNGD